MNNSCKFVDPSYENFLMHYGRPKQKWGVRNFENYDGTLTPAGKERYSIYWTKGTNLKGKKVDYGDSDSNSRRAVGGPEAKEVVRKAVSEHDDISKYQKADGSLTAEGKKKYGDILTNKQMSDLVRNYNSANGTNYKVGEVTFKKDGKIYTPEGKLLDSKTAINKASVTQETKKGLFGREKELSYKEQLKQMRGMSNEDLQRAIERARLEKDYVRELNIHKSRGEKFIDQMKDNTAAVAGELGKQALRDIGMAALEQKILPAIREKTGLQTDEIWKGMQEAAKAAQRAAQQAQQAQQQKPQQNNQQGGNTGSKPLEQTSNKDLRSMARNQGVSEDQANKMSRDELISTLRKGSGSNNPQAKSQPSKEGGVSVTRDDQGRVASVSGTLKPSTKSNSERSDDENQAALKEMFPGLFKQMKKGKGA